MDAPLVVIIAKSDHTSALRKRVGTDHAIAVYADAESLRAIEAIVSRPPKFVALDPAFVTTARGAALVAQVKGDPPRFATNGDVAAIINGERCEVIDLSVTGAQVVVPTRLRPDQPLRITLFDREVQTPCRGIVAWAVAESTRGVVRYRAGVKFSEADAETLEVFCRRHIAVPDGSVDQPA